MGIVAREVTPTFQQLHGQLKRTLSSAACRRGKSAASLITNGAEMIGRSPNQLAYLVESLGFQPPAARLGT